MCFFFQKPEDLASNLICKSCMEKLKQSYNFIQNSKSVTKLLFKYIDKLKSKIIQLIVQLKKSDEGSIRCIDLDYEEINNNSSPLAVPTAKTTEKSTRLIGDRNEQFFVQRMKSPKRLLENVIKNNPEKIKDNLKCGFCSEPFNTFKSLQDHVEEHFSSISCSSCLKHHDSNTLRCQECGNTCIHLKHLIHFQEQIQRNSKAKCLDCDFTCRKKETLIAHINKQHFDFQPYICGSCNKTFHSKRSLNIHVASHNKLSKCNFCGLDMDDESSLEVHKDFCKERKIICKNQAKEKHQILKESQHGKVLFMNNMKTETKTYVKSKIKQNMNTKSHLNAGNTDHITKNNLTLHPSELQWEKCDNKLDTRTKKAKKQKPYLPCELCDFKAWNGVLLDCHMNRYHLKIKPYVCHICSKDFIGKHLLKKHIKLHTVDHRITCTNCGKKLANPSCLKSHLKLHTGEKNYPCDICGEKFRSSSIMNVHRVKKHTEKDIACPLCPSKFFTLVELRRHVVKMHWKKDTKFDPREVKGLENHYHLFHDGRRIMMDDQVIDFFLPC